MEGKETCVSISQKTVRGIAVGITMFDSALLVLCMVIGMGFFRMPDEFYWRLPWNSQSVVSYPAMANVDYGQVLKEATDSAVNWLVAHTGPFWGGEGGDE